MMTGGEGGGGYCPRTGDLRVNSSGANTAGIGGLGGLNNGGIIDGLNPNRQRKFGVNALRVETPSLSEMQARQKAIVA